MMLFYKKHQFSKKTYRLINAMMNTSVCLGSGVWMAIALSESIATSDKALAAYGFGALLALYALVTVTILALHNHFWYASIASPKVRVLRVCNETFAGYPVWVRGKNRAGAVINKRMYLTEDRWLMAKEGELMRL
jgi:hypothetical protein